MIKETIITHIFTYDEVLKASLSYFNNDELAATTWINKYALKNNKGDYLELTPDDMHQRMAAQFARIEDKYSKDNKTVKGLSAYGKQRKKLNKKTIYNYFKDFKYVIPQGSVMFGLGNNEVMASLSNCIVIPPIYDSYGGIMYTDQQMAQLFKRRCGVGVDLSNLRPKDTLVSNAAGSTTGAVSFMNRFSETTREVAQNGRRGALMLTLDVAHPNIQDFVTIKQDLSKITGANISVRLSDEFMEAVEKDDTFMLRWPINDANPKITKDINARDLWNTIIKSAHNTAEPGLIFWDRQHYYSTSSLYPGFENSSTNPCSEIAMQGGDSCRLIAVNLYSFVEHPFSKKAKFNYKKFYEVVYETQRLMDDLVDLELESVSRIIDKINNDPEPQNIKQVELDTWELLQETGKKGRRTGLGFTALGDCIAALGEKFDSNNSLKIVDEIMREKMRAEFDSSIDMAITRSPFESFNRNIEDKSELIQMMKTEFTDVYERMMTYGRRNISISTVAPTGSLSMLAQVSSGIEPVFLLSYTRRRKINVQDENAKIDFVDDLGDAFEEFTVYHKKLNEWMHISGETDVTKSPYFGATAQEIDWKKRVELQAIVQKYTTHSISSTINLDKNVSVEQVGDIYLESWKKGLKGITVYRDGSRSGILVATDDKTEEKKQNNGYYKDTLFPKRPKNIEAEIIRFHNESEKWLAVVGLIEGRPYEIFTGKMKDAFNLPNWVEKGWVIKSRNDEGVARYDFQYVDSEGYKVTIEGLSRSFDKEFWNYAKLISGIMRHGMPMPYVVDLIQHLNLYDDHINTWKNGVTRALKRFVADGTAAADKKCPECNDPDGLIYSEGCLKCVSCGYSKCG
jgi:ribonucleoside-diphosphate reductase alpha chain